jgi:CHASE3 domain sensor protein
MESGLRGYLLTQDEKYLIPFNAALKELNQYLILLAEHVSDNPVQVKNVT